MDTIFLCRLDELPDGDSGGFDPWRQDAYLNADRPRIVCAAHGATNPRPPCARR